MELLSSDSAQKAWQNRLKKQRHGFLYTPLGIKNLKIKQHTNIGENEEGANLPINLRGKTIGEISLKRISRQWSEKEKTLVSEVADQVALAVENARLVDETQEQASRDQLTSEFSSRLRETLDMDTVVKTAIEEMQKTFNLKEVEVRLSIPSEEKDAN